MGDGTTHTEKANILSPMMKQNKDRLDLSHHCYTTEMFTLPNPQAQATSAAFAQARLMPDSASAQVCSGLLRSAQVCSLTRRGRNRDLSHQKSSTFNEGPEKSSPPQPGIPNMLPFTTITDRYENVNPGG
jgi:hypothetical protein